MRIMIACGEPSGDLYAGALVSALRQRVPEVDVFGLGGARLAAAGGRLVGDFRGLSVTGLTEAVRVLPRSLSMLRRLVASARATLPDVFVAIDFPDFNFRLMAAVRRLGIPVVYYVSPQLWAWRPGRIRAMQRHVRRVLAIFPFEEPLYREAGVPVEFVGHPLVEIARPSRLRTELLAGLGLTAGAPTLALLPGSRRNEVQRLVPVLAGALPRIHRHVSGLQVMVARAPNLPDALFEPLRRVAQQGAAVPLAEVEEATDDVLAASDVAIVASGTATVQCAIHERPMVVVYRLSPLTYRLGRPLVRVDTYAMPNLVAGRRIVPELIQDACTPARIAEECVALFVNPERHARMRDDLREVRARLGAPGASGRAADAVLRAAGHQAVDAAGVAPVRLPGQDWRR
jgi:lipid-A-disaccharide synthase